MPRDYNRYELVENNDGSLDQMPFVPISTSPTDKYEEWVVGRSRMDKLAQRYYGNPFFDWLILYANPQYISEFDIPDGTTIRIPFPLDSARKKYEDKLKQIRES
jgi:hypothetical protein